MADEIRTGVVFEGEDDLSPVLDRIADNTVKSARRQEDSLEDVEKQADRTGLSLADMGNITSGVADAFRMAAEVGRMLADGFRMTTEAALAQRSETDEQRQSWEEMTGTLTDLAAMIGDILIPITLGLADALAPVVKGTEEFGKANKAMIASKIGEYLESFAKVLVQGVAVGLKVVIGAWATLRAGVAMVTGAFASFVSTVTEGLQTVLGSIKRAAEFMGMDGLAGSIEKAEGVMKSFGDQAEGIAEAAADDVKEIWEGYSDLSDTIDSVTIPVIKALGNVSESVNKQAGKGIKKLTEGELELGDATEKTTKKIEKQKEVRDEMAGLLAQQWELQQEMALARQEEFERISEQMQEVADVGQGMGDSVGQSLAGIASGAQTVGEGLRDVMTTMASSALGAIRQVVMGEAVRAAAGAFAAHAGVGPFIGLALGTAAAGAAFGFVEALLGSMPAFAFGGVVPGNGAMTDSVMVRAQPRERILSHAELFRAGSLFDRMLSGELNASGPRGGGGSGVTVQVQALYPYRSATEFDRVTGDYIKPSLRRLQELA